MPTDGSDDRVLYRESPNKSSDANIPEEERKALKEKEKRLAEKEERQNSDGD